MCQEHGILALSQRKLDFRFIRAFDSHMLTFWLGVGFPKFHHSLIPKQSVKRGVCLKNKNKTGTPPDDYRIDCMDHMIKKCTALVQVVEVLALTNATWEGDGSGGGVLYVLIGRRGKN